MVMKTVLDESIQLLNHHGAVGFIRRTTHCSTCGSTQLVKEWRYASFIDSFFVASICSVCKQADVFYTKSGGDWGYVEPTNYYLPDTDSSSLPIPFFPENKALDDAQEDDQAG